MGDPCGGGGRGRRRKFFCEIQIERGDWQREGRETWEVVCMAWVAVVSLFSVLVLGAIVLGWCGRGRVFFLDRA